MTKRRIRVTLGAWMVVVAVLCAGVAIPILVVRARKQAKARAGCIANLLRLQQADEEWPAVLDGRREAVSATSAWFIVQHPTNVYCPLAKGTNRTQPNSYHMGGWPAPPTCRICPEEHRLP